MRRCAEISTEKGAPFPTTLAPPQRGCPDFVQASGSQDLSSQHGGVDQRRVKPLRIHRLVQKVVCPGADLAPRRSRIGADEKRWNFERTAERAAEPFDGVNSGQSS